ncbi:hypothetical protein J9097_004367 [Vibrio vulnificus]|nr:hypothetical protein [Vibrio vulnificus]
MVNVEFYCDEAGRLGYVDQPENYNGEFTLVAGLVVETHNKLKIIEFCDYLASCFGASKANGKFHITDLESNREPLRNEVFHFLKSENIPLAYGANYFQPLHLEYMKQKQINANAVVEMKAKGIGLSKNISVFKKNAQAEAFYNFYSKAMGCSLHVFNKPVLGLVKTDRIDSKVYEEYSASIARYHSLDSLRPLQGRHYDYQTGEVHNFGVSVNVQTEDPRFKLLTESRGEIEIIGSNVSILSDIVANSLNHHLLGYVSNSGFGPLNSIDAIDGYPLAEQILAVGQKSMDLRYPYSVA